MTEKSKIDKLNNFVSGYADSFGYSSFGSDDGRFGSIAFFQHITEWPNQDGQNVNVENVKYAMATIRMPETMMLELAEFIMKQHNDAKSSVSLSGEVNADGQK